MNPTPDPWTQIQLERERRILHQVFTTGHPILYTLDDYAKGEDGVSEWKKRQALFTFKFAGAP